MDFVRRQDWGAAKPSGKPVSIPTPVVDLFLHHSVTPDEGAKTVRQIQRFHQQTQNWADIAYTVLYSPSERRFYEGRGFGIAGAHTRNHNRTAHGLCVLGNWQTDVPPMHVIDDLGEFARWHGTAYGPNKFRPHNAVSATLCPGQHLLAILESINVEAERDMTPIDQPTRDWITNRVEADFGTYDAWADAVRRYGDD